MDRRHAQNGQRYHQGSAELNNAGGNRAIPQRPVRVPHWEPLLNNDVSSDYYSHVLQQLQKQIEYYFGPENLPSDEFLLHKLAVNRGSVPICDISQFRRLQEIYTTLLQQPGIVVEPIESLIARSTRYSHTVLVSDDGCYLRPKIIPNLLCAGVAADPYPLRKDAVTPETVTTVTASPTSFASDYCGPIPSEGPNRHFDVTIADAQDDPYGMLSANTPSPQVESLSHPPLPQGLQQQDSKSGSSHAGGGGGGGGGGQQSRQNSNHSTCSRNNPNSRPLRSLVYAPVAAPVNFNVNETYAVNSAEQFYNHYYEHLPVPPIAFSIGVPVQPGNVVPVPCYPNMDCIGGAVHEQQHGEASTDHPAPAQFGGEGAFAYYQAHHFHHLKLQQQQQQACINDWWWAMYGYQQQQEQHGHNHHDGNSAVVGSNSHEFPNAVIVPHPHHSSSSERASSPSLSDVSLREQKRPDGQAARKQQGPRDLKHSGGNLLPPRHGYYHQRQGLPPPPSRDQQEAPRPLNKKPNKNKKKKKDESNKSDKVANACDTKNANNIFDEQQFPDLLPSKRGDRKTAAAAKKSSLVEERKVVTGNVKSTSATGVKKNYAEALKKSTPPKPAPVVGKEEGEKVDSTQASDATVASKSNDATTPEADGNSTTLSAQLDQLSLK